MTTPPTSSTPPADNSTGATQSANVASGTQSSQISDLANQLTQPDLSFDPCTIRKGTITATNPTNAPPDVSLQISGDATTTIDGVVYLDSYSPVVGDTVLIIKQGTDICVLGQVNDTGTGSANGWVTPTLGSGFTTNGNSNGPVQYRLIIDNGERKMQWRGSVAITGTPTAICTVAETAKRPSARRSMLAARLETGGSNDVKLDFNTDGTVVLVGGTTTGGLSPTLSHQHYLGYTDYQTCGYLSQAGSDLCHAHYAGYSDFQLDTHSHTVAFPTWVSFNGVEYFL